MELDNAMPSYEVINRTCNWLGPTLNEVIDVPVARKMVAVLLGSIGKRPGDDPELYICGLTQAITDVDELLTDGATPLISQCALAYAVRKMIREQIFPPAPAEIRAACEQMSVKLNSLHWETAHYRNVRDAVDDILLSYGSRERWPSLGAYRDDEIPF
jgi:hypothetical protein